MEQFTVHQKKNPHIKRKRIHSSRKLSMFLLSLGLTATTIGCLLLISSRQLGNEKFLMMGIIYISCGIAVILVRKLLLFIYMRRRERLSLREKPYEQKYSKT